MPELPEVEAFKHYFKKTSLHKQISAITIKSGPSLTHIGAAAFKKELIGKKFSNAERRGKYLIITIAGSQKKLIMHFGLTGSLVYQKKENEMDRFARIIFNFKNNTALDWVDKRKFGKMWLTNDTEKIKRLSHLGKDALKITSAEFLALAHQRKSKNIKSLLMDQTLIAGIGNEYSDEILFQAGINPHHKVTDLTDAQLRKIYQKIKSVLKYAIQIINKDLKTIKSSDLLTMHSSKGFKSSYLQAHRHTDKKCPKHHNESLKKATIAGRTTYYCPKDQQ